MIIKNQKEKETLREAGRRLAVVLDEVIKRVVSGVTEKELDDVAIRLIKEGGDEPAFLNYIPKGASRPYPAALCVSTNNSIVHGIPGGYVIQEGDIIGLDIGLVHDGIIVDMAKTVAVGKVNKETTRLMEATKEALKNGISAARAGNHVGDVSHAIESAISGTGFSIAHELGGHGVGKKVHEAPFIPNFGKPGTGPELREGEVLALEPIINLGSGNIICLTDGYTIQTKDGSISVHFEHTILVTKNGGEIITKI